MERQQRCVTAAPSDSLQVEDGHRREVVWGGGWGGGLVFIFFHYYFLCCQQSLNQCELPVKVGWFFYLWLKGIGDSGGALLIMLYNNSLNWGKCHTNVFEA